MHALYTKAGLVTFGVQLGKYWHPKKQVFKKEVHPPNGFQKFTIDTIPRIRGCDNALGMLCGTTNGIFALDIDEPSALDEVLKICGKEVSDLPADLPIQQSPRGLHLIFGYDERLDNINGRSCVIRNHPELPIDTRTTDNFIYVAPSAYKDSDVDWHYHWRDGIFPYKNGQAPPRMPDWLYEVLIKEDERAPKMKPRLMTSKKRPTLAEQQALMNFTQRDHTSRQQPTLQMRFSHFINAANDIFTRKVYTKKKEVKPMRQADLSKLATRI